MTIALRVLAIALYVVATIARAESFSYELYELSDNGERKLLAQGVRNYTVRDVSVEEQGYGNKTWSSKEIPVERGFAIGLSDFREQDLTGFGLWLKDRGSISGRWSAGGFSWDWFDRQAGEVYRKLQGGGSVRVLLSASPQGREIASVEVLEDIVLRVNNRPWFFFSHRDTHHLVLKKGSVLRFGS